MKVLYTVLGIFAYFISSAQIPEPAMYWLKVFGGSSGDQVDQFSTKTPDGGFIITLSTSSLVGPFTDTFCSAVPSYVSTIFAKYNSDGNIREWFKCRKSSWADTGYIFMFQTIDNKFILGGVANSGNSWLIRKEDASGNTLWVKAYGGSGSQMLYSMTPTDDGGYILFGSSYGNDGDIGFHYGSLATRDYWVLKVDMNGDKLWSRVYGGTGEDIGGSVVPGPSGGCYIVGSTNSTDYECIGSHGNTEVFIARLDINGDIVWRKMLGGSGYDGGGEGEGCRAIHNGSGGILVATTSGSNDGDVSHQINYPGNNVWVINVDSANNIVWDKCYGGGGTEYPNSICRGTDESIWIMGCSQTSGGQVNTSYGGKDAWLVHTDGTGTFLTAKVLGSTGQDIGSMVYPLSDGSVFVGGYYGAGSGVFPISFQGGVLDAYIAKFSPWPDGIKSVSLNFPVTVYPNPASERINIISGNQGNAHVQISDAIGRLVYECGFSSEMQLSVLDWSKGLYYVQITGANGYERVIQKLVIQ